MAKRWNWSLQSVRTFTNSQTFATRLATQRETPAGTVYLIVNYDKYQSVPEPENTASNTANGTAVTQDQHRTNTRTSSKALTTKSIAPAAPGGSWVSRFAEHWSQSVGAVPPGQVGKGLKDAVGRHGEQRVFRAMRAYIAVQKSAGKNVRFGFFASEVEVWVERSGGALEVVGGEMSPALELLTRPGA